MAKADDEKSSYGAFERFLYIFFIPAIFTIILSGVLLSLFDYDVMNTALKIANKIPVIDKVIPDPKEDSQEGDTPSEIVKGQADELDDLNAKLADKEAEVSKLAEANKQKDEQILELQANMTLMEEQLKQKTQTDEQYRQQISSLASMYAKMTPSKSAPILQNLTQSELVLVLTEMKPEDRVKVLEKMDPKTAAAASIQLKDRVPAKDLQIAALQERLEIYQEEDPNQTAKLNSDELGRTVAAMTPKSAATLLMEMMSIDQVKVIAILTSMDDAARSRILSALADLSKEDAAKITAKLGG